MRGSAGAILLTALLLLAGGAGTHAVRGWARQCDTGGRVERYLVVFEPSTRRAQASAQVDAACGELATFHAPIAVGVATSADDRFTEYIGPHRATASREPGHTSQSAGTVPRSPDELTGNANDLTDRQWNLRAIRAEQAHTRQRGSDDVVIGVLDSGIDADHPDLRHSVDRELSAGCLSGAADPSPSSWRPGASAHGTHVAGVLAAADDARGVTGVAPGARVASVRVVDDAGRVTPEAAICGLMWAADHDFDVVNGSFLVSPWPGTCARGSGRDVVREAIRRALRHAHERGTLTVVAASNKAVELTPSHALAPARHGCEVLPAGLHDAVSVSASTRDGRKAGYSSYGLGVIDLTAPGGDGGRCVISTVPGGYASLCGTSMAAPHVAGVAALVASERPGATPDQLRRTLTETATSVPCSDDDLTGNGTQGARCEGHTGYNSFFGYGRVDALSAVEQAAGFR